MEAETRLTSGAAARSHAGAGPHGGMQKCFYPGGLENPYREKPGQRTRRRAGSWRRIKGRGWGRGRRRWQEPAGRARLKGITQHISKAPSHPALPFLQSSRPAPCKAFALTSDFLERSFVPRKFSQRTHVPSPSVILQPPELGCQLLPWELPPGLCLSDMDGTGVCLQDQNMTLGVLFNGELPMDHGRAGGAEQPRVVVSRCCSKALRKAKR